VWHYVRIKRRPRLLTLLLVAIVGFFGVVSYLESSRTRVSEGGVAAAEMLTPGAAWHQFVSGGSTEMLPSLARELATEGEAWRRRPGYLPYVLVTHWIPSAAWNGKPRSYDEIIYSYDFPLHYANQKASNEYSIVGDFYSDGGAVGVVVGLFLVGLLSGRMVRVLSLAQTSVTHRLLFAPFLGLFVMVLRGNIALLAGIAGFIYAPLLLVLRPQDRLQHGLTSRLKTRESATDLAR
jgi:hypothetical protein